MKKKPKKEVTTTKKKTVKATYRTTRKQCQEKIDETLYVCDRCGRKLVPIKTVDNGGSPTFWAGCFHGTTGKSVWGHFTNGVDKDIYELARKLVLEDDFCFSMKREKGIDFEYQFQNAVSGACGIIQKVERMKTTEPRKTKAQLKSEFI